MRKKNRLLLTILLLAGGTSFLFLVLLSIFVTLKSRNAIILDNDSNYYTVKNVSVISNICIGLKSDETFRIKSKAVDSISSEHHFSIIPLTAISVIEFIPDDSISEKDGVPVKYLGYYRVIVTGHHGQLFLKEEKGQLYGVIRFPNWGNGAYEYLKGVRVKDGWISFTRSATTSTEARRLGAGSFFVQRFNGNYYNNGNAIRGYYLNNRGEKNMWEGKR